MPTSRNLPLVYSSSCSSIAQPANSITLGLDKKGITAVVAKEI